MSGDGSDLTPTLESSVMTLVQEGAIAASWGDEEAELRTNVIGVGFDDKPGHVRLMVGGSQDPQFGGGTGLDLRIDREEFEKLLLAVDEEWEGVECSLDTETDRQRGADDD